MSAVAGYGEGVRWDVVGSSDLVMHDALQHPQGADAVGDQVPTANALAGSVTPVMQTLMPHANMALPPPIPPSEEARIAKCTAVMSKVYADEVDNESEEEEWEEGLPNEEEARGLAFQTQLDNTMRQFWFRAEHETQVCVPPARNSSHLGCRAKWLTTFIAPVADCVGGHGLHAARLAHCPHQAHHGPGRV